MPPPRSEAQCHQPLRGVTTTSGRWLPGDALPFTVATTLHTAVGTRRTSATTRTVSPWAAAPSSAGRSVLGTHTVGTP